MTADTSVGRHGLTDRRDADGEMVCRCGSGTMETVPGGVHCLGQHDGGVRTRIAVWTLDDTAARRWTLTAVMS